MITKLLCTNSTQKSLIFLTLFIFSTNAFSQTTAIPDANFEAYLEANSMGDGIDNNGLVTTANINTVTALYVSSKSIATLEGIEDFAALTTLNCSNNSLLNLNVTQNTALRILNCQGNDLTSLDVTQNTALTYLNFVFNDLTTIDVTKNVLLTLFNGYGNQLSSLDLTQNIALTNLTLLSNQLTSLDITKNVALTNITCEYNQLTSLDVSKNVLLTDLNCAHNLITSLDVTAITGLRNLNCAFNELTNLNVTQNPAMLFLSFGANDLTSINVSQNPVLDKLWFHANQLTGLDVSQNLALTELYFPDNSITSLDLHLNTSLIYLGANDNLLEDLNMKNGNNTNVTTFNTTNNSIDLTCITVDDEAWSTANWNNKDDHTEFSEDCALLGVGDFEGLNIKTFPNPTKGNLTISLTSSGSYSLINMLGQKMQKGAFTYGDNTLDMSKLSKGLYLLNVETSQGSVTNKIVKQ